MKSKDKNIHRVKMALTYLLLIAFILVVLYPVYYCFVSSFKDSGQILVGSNFWPEEWLWENYVEAWEKANFATYTKNSIFYATTTMVLSTLMNAICGYVFARGHFPGKGVIFAVKTSMMFLALGSATMYPKLLTLHALGLNKSLWGVIINDVCVGSIANIFMIRAFILSLPKELDEAALMDGCSFMGIFFRITLPLIRPVLMVVAVLTFKGAWNDYLFPMLVTFSNPERRTLAVGLAAMQGSSAAADWSIMLPGAIISAVPLIVLFAFLNKYFMETLTTGAVKG